MGYLSIAQVVPNALVNLIGTISGLFSPEQTKLYAQKHHDALLGELKAGMRITGLFTNIIVVTLLINGSAFIALWQPGQNTRMIYLLMMLTMSGFFFTGIASTLQAVPLLVNKLRNYSLSWLACGVLSLAATLVCVKCFNWGIYAVAAIPQFVDIFANVTFVPVYAALCLRLPWSKFYCVYAQYLVSRARLTCQHDVEHSAKQLDRTADVMRDNRITDTRIRPASAARETGKNDDSTQTDATKQTLTSPAHRNTWNLNKVTDNPQTRLAFGRTHRLCGYIPHWY